MEGRVANRSSPPQFSTDTGCSAIPKSAPAAKPVSCKRRSMGPEASPGSQSLVECQCQRTVSKAGRLRALLLALSLIASSLFSFGGMPSSWWHLVPPSPPPKSVAAGSSVPKYVTTNIEDLRVGDWVLARNPEVTEEEREESPPLIEPDQWRKLTLCMEKPDGGQLDIELLRPAEWLEAVEAEPGAVLEVDLPELGAEGEAEILAVESCPPIDAPPSPDCRVITGRFCHASAEILDLRVTGLPEPIGVTANHPFWSEDRQAFLPAGHLHPGERLRTAADQLCTVLSLRPAPAQAVYNIEVDLEHVYFVSTSGILVHNACGKKDKAEAPSNKAVIGKLDDLGNLRPGESTLLKHLPDQGSPRLNWGQNSRVLRTEMGKGLPIRDASVNPATGALERNTGFLRAERELLLNRGWRYNPATQMWHPPH
jgi:hypothetical protein